MKTSRVALIPARRGSKRIAGKNVRPLAGHPLIAYTIVSALQSGVFDAVVASTDGEEIAALARKYGAEAPFLRPSSMSGDLSPDIDWVRHALSELEARGRTFDAFSILRPTSPFRKAETLRRAWERFAAGQADSLRAVELCRQHPGKMWVVEGERMKPLLNGPKELPWHSRPYQDLPRVFVQNASLEIAWTRVVAESGTISGTAIMPFFTEGYEGFDLNTPEDWTRAEQLAVLDPGILPNLSPEVRS